MARRECEKLAWIVFRYKSRAPARIQSGRCAAPRRAVWLFIAADMLIQIRIRGSRERDRCRISGGAGGGGGGGVAESVVDSTLESRKILSCCGNFHSHESAIVHDNMNWRIPGRRGVASRIGGVPRNSRSTSRVVALRPDE